MIKGKYIAITGRLLFYTRREAFDHICCRGGIPQSSVTRDTDYLVIGSYRDGVLIRGKSNKQLYAEKLSIQGSDIQVITDAEFTVLLWNAPLINE